MADNKAIQTKMPRFFAGNNNGMPSFLYETDASRPEVIAIDKTWSLADFRALLSKEQLVAFDTIYANYVPADQQESSFAADIEDVNKQGSVLGAAIMSMELGLLQVKVKGDKLPDFVAALETKLKELDTVVEAHNASIVAEQPKVEAKEPEVPVAPVATPTTETPATEAPVTPTSKAPKAEVVVVKNELSPDMTDRLENFIKTGEAAVETGNLIFDAMDKLNQAARSNSKVVGNLTSVAKELAPTS